MQSTPKLQSPFHYSLVLLIILAIIIVIAILVFIYKEKIEEIIRKNTLPIIKKRYLSKLDALLLLVNENKIETREAYLSLSNIGREFIKTVTKIDVLTITLDEAKKLDIPNLSDLMAECYPPEFAKKAKSNVIVSIDNARRIITEWK